MCSGEIIKLSFINISVKVNVMFPCNITSGNNKGPETEPCCTPYLTYMIIRV